MSPAPTPETDSKSTSETTAAILKRAILMAAIAEGVLSLMDAVVKMLSATYPIMQLSFVRFAMGTVFAAAIFATNRPQWPSPDTVRFNLIRSVVGVGASLSFFTGLSLLPIAEAMAISFAAPLILAVMGTVFLGERLTPRIGVALLAGFAGMLVIVGGQIGTHSYSPGAVRGAIAVLISTIFYAAFLILLRVRANRDSLPTLLLFQNAGPAVIMAIPAALVWKTPTARDLALFTLIGFLGVVGHSFMIKAFSRAEAARLAPVHYLVLVWGTLYGWLFFGDLPGIATIIGASLVVAATLMARRQ
jgi:drug/metabolite transporter (DMT)-like permease